MAQFFANNSKTSYGHDDMLVCLPGEKGFSGQSASFKRLVRFLKSQGFTAADWLPLGAGGRQLNLFAFSALTTETIRRMPFAFVCKVKKGAETHQEFMKLFPVIAPSDVTVEQVLGIGLEHIESITGTFHCWKIPYEKVQALRTFVLLVQKKLSACGFTAADGPFMEVSFKRSKCVRGRVLKKDAVTTRYYFSDLEKGGKTVRFAS